MPIKNLSQSTCEWHIMQMHTCREEPFEIVYQAPRIVLDKYGKVVSHLPRFNVYMR